VGCDDRRNFLAVVDHDQVSAALIEQVDQFPENPQGSRVFQVLRQVESDANGPVFTHAKVVEGRCCVFRVRHRQTVVAESVAYAPVGRPCPKLQAHLVSHLPDHVKRIFLLVCDDGNTRMPCAD